MIKLLKSGDWALEGTRVVEMVRDVEQSFGAAEDFKLVEAGWARWVKVKPAPEVASEPETAALEDTAADSSQTEDKAE